MKQTIDVLAAPISQIINSSLATGIVPQLLKIAKVCPIYKSGQKNEIGNYRLISALSSFSKNLEKIVFKRINDYYEKMHILIPSQYGFRAQHSTSMALLDIYENISTSVDVKQHVLDLFVDLQ